MRAIRKFFYQLIQTNIARCNSYKIMDFRTGLSLYAALVQECKYWLTKILIVILKILEFVSSIPFFVAPKHFGFTKYAIQDDELRYLDSYASYLTRRFGFTSTILALILVSSFQAFVQAPLSMSRLKSTNVYVVCPIDCEVSSIQKAIDVAMDGDIIRVMQGVYTENIDFKGKNIVLKSESGPDQTTIAGTGDGSVITMKNSESNDAVLEGFTIRGGTGSLINSEKLGGGIYIAEKDTSPIIRKNTITQNEAWKGGGIYIANGSPQIIANTITNNKALNPDSYDDATHGWGGAISVMSGSARIEKNNVTENSASYFGGAIVIYGDATEALIKNNIFQKNFTSFYSDMATGGGAITINKAFVTLFGNSFENNKSAGDGGAVMVTNARKSILIGDRSSPNANIFSENVAQNNGGSISAFMSEVSIDGNVFENTKRSLNAQKGAGIALFGTTNGIIQNNAFYGQKAKQGGALYAENSGMKFINNLIKESEVEDGGSGVEVQASANNTTISISIEHNVFTENIIQVQTGSSLLIHGQPSSVRIINNIIEKTSGGYGFDSRLLAFTDSTVFDYNNVWNNDRGDYSDSVKEKVSRRNISVEPLFINPLQNNYHLQKNSLMIDRGLDVDPLIPDIDGETRPYNGNPDIGFDEIRAPSERQIFYVALDSGDDANGQGTESKPFKTIEQALQMIKDKQGGSIFVQGKRLAPLSILDQSAGSKEHPIQITQWEDKKDCIIDADGSDNGIIIKNSPNISVNGIIVKNALKNGIYISNSPHSRISNNVIYDNKVSGILFESSSDASIVNNTLVNNGNGIYFSQSSIAGKLLNNIIEVGNGQFGLSVDADSQNLFESDYNNIFLSSDTAISGVWSSGPQKFLRDWQAISENDSHSLYGDPKFASRSSGDFRIEPDSPSLDAGSPKKSLVPKDRNGVLRPYIAAPDFIGRVDQGAYEQESPVLPQNIQLTNTLSQNNTLVVSLTLPQDNPKDTEYALTPDKGKTWLQSDGSLKPDIYWSSALSWNHTPVKTNALYSYASKARNAQKTTYSGWSKNFSITTPLDFPKNLSAKNINESSAALSWQDVPETHDSYSLSYGTDPQATNGSTINDIGTNGYKLSQLVAGTTYYWKVRVFNANGGSAWSNAAVLTTTGQKPASETPAETTPAPEETPAPTETPVATPSEAEESFNVSSVRAFPDGASATISWKTNEASTTQVEYGTSTYYGTLTEKNSSLLLDHSITISSLQSDTLFHFRVISVNNDAKEIKSSDYTFITSATPKTPILVSPESWFSTTDYKPDVTGLCQSGLTVKIYIDGLFSGETSANTSDNGTGSFAYKPVKDLLPGEHYVQILSENKSDIESDFSEKHTFYVFSERVSSSLNLFHDQYVNDPINTTSKTQPSLIGLAYAESTIKIYIDNALATEFVAKGDPNAAVAFAFSPEHSLEYGIHRSYYEIYKGGSLVSRMPELVFRVVHELPIPALLSPNDGDSVSSQPTISGIASDENIIWVFVDNSLVGETRARIDAESQKNGFFEYTLPKILKKGKHTIQIQGEDSNGKKSKRSDAVEIYVE